MTSSTTDVNLAERAYEGKLTVEELNTATKEKLETDQSGWSGKDTVHYLASRWCGIEVVEVILDKKVNIDELSHVSICCWYLLLMIVK
jgi:hypothetical protein